MKSIVHVCFSESAGGSLKQVIKNEKLLEGNKVIRFCDDISQGLIRNGIDVEERIDWWSSIDKEEERIRSEEITYLKQTYEKFYKEISEIRDSDLIYLWYGECGSDICGMMYTLQLLEDKIGNIFLINVSEKIDESPNRMYVYTSVSEIMSKELKNFLEIKRKLEFNEYDNLINEWNLLIKGNSILRIFKDGKVQSVNEDYFDIDILKYAENEFKKSARIVGNVIGYSEIRISDYYIFWRVQELVKIGKLEFKGKFGVMREMEVKITQKGLEYMSADSDALLFWKNKEAKIQVEREKINKAKEQGRMEEKINIAKNLMDVLEIKVIAEKTGLTVMQVKNLINT